MIIVADIKTPDIKSYFQKEYNFYQTNYNHSIIYLGVQDQMNHYPYLSNAIPWNHFGRKNIGYMYAIDSGAKKIWDFDDDNDGMVDLQQIQSNIRTVCQTENFNLNPYMYFGVNETISWPRGFPLDFILNKDSFNFQTCDSGNDFEKVAVVQSLANKQPDVDGMYRLTRKTPFDFTSSPGDKLPNLILPNTVFTPFNAQATMWVDSSLDNLALLLLPTTVHGRVADIWRSYFTQWIYKHTNRRLAFSKPYIIQDRNVHNYLADFNSEHPLYLKSSALAKILNELEYDQNLSVKNNLINLYVEMYERRFIEKEDVNLVKVWLEHVFVYRR